MVWRILSHTKGTYALRAALMFHIVDFPNQGHTVAEASECKFQSYVHVGTRCGQRFAASGNPGCSFTTVRHASSHRNADDFHSHQLAFETQQAQPHHRGSITLGRPLGSATHTSASEAQRLYYDPV